MFTQFRVLPLTIWLEQQQFTLIDIILYTSFAYTITIVQKIFITEIFKPQLFSSHAMRLRTRLTEFFLNCRCLLCLAFYIEDKQPDECILRRMSLPSPNFLKCKQVACSVVVACLLLYLFLNWCYCYIFVYSFILFRVYNNRSL